MLKLKTIYIAFIVGYLMALVSCASKERRTVNSDQVLRVAIDLSNIDLGNHQALTAALLKSKKFVIVDRGPGMAMINQERQAQWGVTRSVFEPSQRAAIGGYMRGAGGIIAPIIYCEHTWGFWGPGKKCNVSLTITSARTGEILGSVSQKTNHPDWNKLVKEFIETYPEYFVKEIPTGTRALEESQQVEKSEEDYVPGEYIP